jgi:hypothetical protein
MAKSWTSWQAGQSGNPNGRPKGTKDAITKAFVDDVTEDWGKNGPAALIAAREKNPGEYCRMVASLLPKDQNLKVDDGRQSPFLDLLKQMNEEPGLEKEVARLKAENAALKGETPKDEPETKTDPPAVH